MGMDIVKRVTLSSPVNVTSSISVNSALLVTHVPPATTVKMVVYVSMMRTKSHDASVESAFKGTSAKRKSKSILGKWRISSGRRAKMIHLIILYKKVLTNLIYHQNLIVPIKLNKIVIFFRNARNNRARVTTSTVWYYINCSIWRHTSCIDNYCNNCYSNQTTSYWSLQVRFIIKLYRLILAIEFT